MTAMPILGGVGLGVCSACRAPGAFWYESVVPGFRGVWMCDSCAFPDASAARIRAHLQQRRDGGPW